MLLALLAAVVGASCALAVEHPVLSVSVKQEHLDSYLSRVRALLDMTEEEMRALIPTQSGLYFCDCPNCDAGRQEGQFAFESGSEYVPWTVEEPDVIRCKYCGHEYPSEQYPMKGALEVTNPRGEVQKYPYYEDDTGYRHHFTARIDYHKIRYMETAANAFARLYVLTEDPLYARRSAFIMHRFAQVYPGYCYHFDYPFREKVVYSGDVAPEDFRRGFRTARWSWWAYMDIPSQLVEAYDLIVPSGAMEQLSGGAGTDVAAELEAFFTAASEEVLANRDDLGNMSPGMWAAVIRAGRVLGKPEYVHKAIGRLRRFLEAGFFYDGVWKEGAPSYHSQVMGGLGTVFAAARGHSDPPEYRHPETGERFDDLDIESQFPFVAQAQESLMRMRLPNGRLVPVHDTWSTNARATLEESRPYLLPALGHACLARGEGEGQFQAHLTWSGGYGHTHYDGLSLLLFAHGKELLSDLGYTHTRARAWTLATTSHNTVVADHESQVAGRGERDTYGSLRYFDVSNEACQVVSVDNPHVYPDLATRYRRTLVLVAIDEASSYLVDLFEVEGGDQHDYFLHGSADRAQTVTVPEAAEFADLATLVPAGIEFVPAQNEGEAGKAADPGYAYGYLGDLSTWRVGAGSVAPVSFRFADSDVGLRVHLALSSGDQLIHGGNPAVRPAREDDKALDRHKRAFAMVRREAGDSVFASVIEPTAGEPKVRAVRRLEIPGARVAMEVEMADGRRDLVLLRPRNVATRWLDREVVAEVQLAVLSLAGGAPRATVVGGSLQWGDVSLTAQADEGALLAVDRDAHTIVVDRPLDAPVGSTVTIDHAGKRVSPYQVAASEVVGGHTRITVAEDPGFEWDAQTSMSRFVFVPHTSYTGAHAVRQVGVAHSGR